MTELNFKVTRYNAAKKSIYITGMYLFSHIDLFLRSYVMKIFK
jgi:hypothetical protein